MPDVKASDTYNGKTRHLPQFPRADFDGDGDGKLDLLVGDFCTTLSPRGDLTPEERAEVLAEHRQRKDVSARLRALIEPFRQDFLGSYSEEEKHSDISRNP